MNLTSSTITKIARIMLGQHGVYCWRQNQIAVKGRTFIGEPGQSDLIGITKATGLFVACEVKAIGDRLSDGQKAFLRKIKDANGIALVAFEGRGGNVEMVDYDEYLASKITT